MTLPGSGAISLGQVNTELGRASNQAISMNDSAVRSLAGVASGAISMSSLWGKSNVSWSMAGGNYSDYGQPTAYWSVTCNQDCVWTWSVQGVGTVSPSSGATSRSLSFSVNSPNNYGTRETTLAITGISNGIRRDWNVTLKAYGRFAEIDF